LKLRETIVRLQHGLKLKICQEFFLSEPASVIALQRQDQSRKVVEEVTMVVGVVVVVMVVVSDF
jgi:hypothetical protein